MNNKNFDEDLANQIYSKKFEQGKKSKKVITIFRKLFKICCIILIIIGIFNAEIHYDYTSKKIFINIE